MFSPYSYNLSDLGRKVKILIVRRLSWIVISAFTLDNQRNFIHLSRAVLAVCQKNNRKQSYNQHNTRKDTSMNQDIRSAGAEKCRFKLLNAHFYASSISPIGTHPDQLSSLEAGFRRIAAEYRKWQDAG